MPDKSPALTVKAIEQAVRAGKTVRWRYNAEVFETNAHKFLVNIPMNLLKFQPYRLDTVVDMYGLNDFYIEE